MQIKEKKQAEERKIGGVFLKIYGLLLVACLCTVLFIMGWVNLDARRTNRVRVAEENLNRLENMDSEAALIADSTAQVMTQMLWSKDFCNYLITCRIPDQDQIYRINNQLNNCLRGERNYLRGMYFVQEQVGRIYRSGSYEYQDVEDSPVYQILRQAYEEGQAILWQEDSRQCTCTRLVNTQGRLFLVQEFRLGVNTLGACIAEFARESFGEILGVDFDNTSEDVCIYDSLGQPIFRGMDDGDAMAAQQQDPKNWIHRGNLNRLNSTAGRFYALESSMTGWTYLVPAEEAASVVTLADTLRVSLPAILVLLLIVFGMSQYVIRTLYQPIVKLVDLVGGAEEKRRQPRGTEFEYLVGAYTDARSRQEEMMTTIDSLAPELFENTVRKLIEGKVFTREELSETLKGIHSALSVDGRFAVCTCIIEEPGNRQVSEREWNLYVSSLEELIREKSIKDASVYSLRMDRSQMVIILRFNEQTSAVAIKRSCREFCQSLVKSTEPLPYTLWAEYGQIYNCMTDLHESYLESMEKIRYTRKQLAEKDLTRMLERDELALGESAGYREHPTAQGEEKTRRTAQEERKLMKEQVEEMIRLSLKNAMDSAMVIHHQVTDEMVGQSDELEHRRNLCRMYMDEWAEQMSLYPIPQGDLEELVASGNPREILELEDEEELFRRLEQRVRISCRILVNYGKTNRYKYIDQARSFMESNYDNNGLSLNIVADHIGISSSYLSELMVEVTGMKFSAALAELRVNRAKELLQNTDLSITEIGENCGFNSVQNFIRVFKKVSGYTPGQYRNLKNV